MEKNELLNSIYSKNNIEISQFIMDLGDLFCPHSHKNKNIVNFSAFLNKIFEKKLLNGEFDFLEDIEFSKSERNKIIPSELKGGNDFENKKKFLSKMLNDKELKSFEIIDKMLNNNEEYGNLIPLSDYLDAFSKNYDIYSENDMILTGVKSIDDNIIPHIMRQHRDGGETRSDLYINHFGEIAIYGVIEDTNEIHIEEVESLDTKSKSIIIDLLNNTYNFANKNNEQNKAWDKNNIDYYQIILHSNEAGNNGISLGVTMGLIETEETGSLVLGELKSNLVNAISNQSGEMFIEGLDNNVLRRNIDDAIRLLEDSNTIHDLALMSTQGGNNKSNYYWKFDKNKAKDIINELFSEAGFNHRIIDISDKNEIVELFPERNRSNVSQRLKNTFLTSGIPGLELDYDNKWTIDKKHMKNYLNYVCSNDSMRL